MKIDFYYWNYQCPIIDEMILLLKEYESIVTINYYDISIMKEKAIKNHIFFPFLTIFNDKIRWRSPLKKSIIDQILEGKDLKEKPYIINHSNDVVSGELVELNDSTIHCINETCALRKLTDSCKKKKQFLSKNCNDFYGYLHFVQNRLVGGVEYIPSLQVPYDIPKNNQTVFLTCLYQSSPDYDYKSYPLKKLEQRLFKDYNRIIAISCAKGTFPNGDLEWFLNQGYSNEGVISIEEDYSTLHLVSKYNPHLR